MSAGPFARLGWSTSETLATELIDAVGPGGNYLGEIHTARHFRDEVFLSPLSPVSPWAQSQDKPDQFDQTRRARQMAAELWHKPIEPVLAEDQIRAIDLIVERATR